MIIGYLRFKETMAVRRLGIVGTGERARYKPVFDEYKRGQLITLFSMDYKDRYKLFIDDDAVEILDKDKKPTTWQKETWQGWLTP